MAEIIKIETQRLNDLKEFIDHAPGIICNFEKAINQMNMAQIERYSKIGRTLFQQINKSQLANEFDSFGNNQNINQKAANSLIRLAKKQILKAQSELIILKERVIPKHNNTLEVNINLIIDLVGPSEEALKEIVDMYGQQCVEYLSIIHHSFKINDLKKVRKISHTMKSSFSMIGCDLLKQAAVRMESICEDDKPDNQRLLDELKSFDEMVKESIHLLKKEVASQKKL